MAEAEDVLQDAARHATIYARSLWLRHRGPENKPRPIVLAQVAERLDLLTSAVFNRQHALRIAQAPAPPTMLVRLFRRHDVHRFGSGTGGGTSCSVPATDGHSIWLPNDVGAGDMPVAIARYRAMALQQAMRGARGSASTHPASTASAASPTRLEPLTTALYLLLEAQAADIELLRRLPGAASDITRLRQWVLKGYQARPPALPAACQAVQE